MNKTEVITFRADPAMAQALVTLGTDSDNSRANVVYLLVSAALSGCADETVAILKARR